MDHGEIIVEHELSTRTFSGKNLDVIVMHIEDEETFLSSAEELGVSVPELKLSQRDVAENKGKDVRMRRLPSIPHIFYRLSSLDTTSKSRAAPTYPIMCRR